MSVGIIGLGAFLPDDVRTNDWWPAGVVTAWSDRKKKFQPTKQDVPDAPPTEGIRATIAELEAVRSDPFKGAVLRRIMPRSMETSDMESRAAEAALADAGIAREKIDFLSVYSACPDRLILPNSAVVHAKLGLPERCFSVDVQAACNSFALQLQIANRMIASGQARYGLLVQSCSLSRILPPDEPFSAWFGDGATAVVLGPVEEGFGVLAASNRTDGTMAKALVGGIPGKHWYEDGRTVLYAEDRQVAQAMALRIVDCGKQVVNEALAEKGLGPADVDFFACHQGTPWLGRAVQNVTGMPGARTINSFTVTASLSAANIPFVLQMGRKEGLLREGDLVATYSGGTGITWSSVVMRWGRAGA